MCRGFRSESWCNFCEQKMHDHGPTLAILVGQTGRFFKNHRRMAEQFAQAKCGGGMGLWPNPLWFLRKTKIIFWSPSRRSPCGQSLYQENRTLAEHSIVSGRFRLIGYLPSWPNGFAIRRFASDQEDSSAGTSCLINDLRLSQLETCFQRDEQ